MSRNSLKNKVVLVTGASGGIGNAIVNKLESQNAKIFALYNRNFISDHLANNVCWLQADITKAEDRDKILLFALQKYGRIDALINCAGFLEPGEFFSIDVNHLYKMIDVNFTSTLILTQKILEIMKAQSFGHIINIGSLGGIVPMPYSAVYSATKFALRGFTFSLVEELKGTGINISLVTPGSVITKMLDYEALENNFAISFVSNPISPIKVADAVLKVIRKPRIELSVPGSEYIPSKLLVFSPKLFSSMYKFLHRAGISQKRKYLERYNTKELLKGEA
jgi:short-subunit dehydrogenase